MADFILDPNMGFPNPTPGQDPGPDYANNQQTTNTVIGAHDHSPGKGVLITPAGININADLPINENNLTTVKTINFSAQTSPISAVSPNLGCVYVAGNELYYNDEVGNIVQITLSGSVNSGSGSITGLPSGTASASFSAGTFFWRAATNVGANMDAASYILRNNTVSSFGLTLSPPNSMAADFALILPSIPGTNSFVSLDTSGNFGTITQNGGIVGSNIAAATITGNKIVAQTITQNLLALKTTGTTVGIGGVAVSNSSGFFTTTSSTPVDVTNLTVTITTNGRPVKVFLQSDGSGNNSRVGPGGGGGSTLQSTIYFLNGATVISTQSPTGGNPDAFHRVPSSSFSLLDMTVNGIPGTYTYKVQQDVAAPNTGSTEYAVLVAYEI